jgi:hypothetical protein
LLRKFTLLLLLFASLQAGESKMMNYGVLDNHSFIPPKGWFNLQISNLQTNETVDIFNIRASETKDLGNLGATIGNMDGFETRIGTGIFQNDALFFKYSYQNIEYAGSELKNSRIEFWNRYQLHNNNYSFFSAVSFDIGYLRNSAEDITISNHQLIDSLIKKVYPNSGVTKNNEMSEILNKPIYMISIDGSETMLTDSNGNSITPSFSTENMSSNTLYLKLLFGSQVGSKTLFDLYTTILYTDISSEIVIPNNIMDHVPSSFKSDLSRSETAMNVGLSFISEFSYFLFELNYEYTRIFRDSDLTYENNSHTLDSVLSLRLSRNISLFAGGRLMFQQMNSDIPYLYNQYTETQFDRKYGFARFGLIYNLGVF